jgi:hypothetical protein
MAISIKIPTASALALVLSFPICSHAQTQVNASANTAQNQNNSAASSNERTGIQLIAVGSAMPFCTGCYLIYMGVTSLNQAKAQRNSASGAGRAAWDSAYNATQFSDYVNTKDIDAAYADAMRKLSENGYKLDQKKMSVTDPNGKVFNFKDLSRNASDMAMKTGFPEDEIKKALDTMDEKAKELSKVKVAKVDHSAGGKHSSSEGSGAPPAEGAGLVGFNFGGRERKPTNVEVAGFKKYLGNDAIGVAGDDIFLMIKRRYEEKNKAEFFSK